MNLLIHDLSQERRHEAEKAYPGWKIIRDSGAVKPCVGCFSCWNRTPGQCAIRDGYEDIGALFHRAEEVVVISRYTFGGFSGFVKNVFDRCLGYALPHFEVVDGESHHKRRYDEDKPFSFIFYGHGLGEKEKDAARRYVKAVCANVRCHVKSVDFRDWPEDDSSDRKVSAVSLGKVVLLNGSMRVNGNTSRLSEKLIGQMKRERESLSLGKHLNDLPSLVNAMKEATDIVVCTPLYLDGLPSQVIRFMEAMRREYRGESKRIYVLANMGLYESRQLVNLFDAVRQWCGAMGFHYCGGLGVSAGELIGVLMQHLPFNVGFTRNVARGMKRLAEAMDAGQPAEDIFAEPFCFPRWLYIRIANSGWKKMAKANGLKPEDLFRRIQADSEDCPR